MTWDVFDARDFPDFGHAWIRIGNAYYDPTFDDPLGNTKTREASEYLYFWLPKALFYTNRFDEWYTPQVYVSLSEKQRKKIVEKNLWKFLSLPEYSQYTLLHNLQFKKDRGYILGEEITIASLDKYFEIYDEIIKEHLLAKTENERKKQLAKISFDEMKNIFQNFIDLIFSEYIFF